MRRWKNIFQIKEKEETLEETKQNKTQKQNKTKKLNKME